MTARPTAIPKDHRRQRNLSNTKGIFYTRLCLFFTEIQCQKVFADCEKKKPGFYGCHINQN